MITELAHYKHRCEDTERECLNAKNEMRQMESFYTMTKGVKEKMLTDLHRKTRQITNLRKQLDGQRDLEPYLSIQHPHNEVTVAQQFFYDFQSMKDQIASMVVANGTGKPSIGSLYGQSADLDALLHTVFGVDIRSNMKEISNISPDLTIHELIQALTGAAIHCWVFESWFHPIAMTNTPLLQKYRDHIATLCKYRGNRCIHFTCADVNQGVMNAFVVLIPPYTDL